MDSTQRDAALDRLRDDYVRGALEAEEYARLRKRVLEGDAFESPSSSAPASGPMPMPSSAATAPTPTFDPWVPAAHPGYDPTTRQPLAGWGRRAAAYFLDVLVFIVPLIPIGVWASSTSDPVTGEISDASAGVLALYVFLLWPVAIWLMLGTWGQTPGKAALSIAVRRGEDGTRIGLARALGRMASVFLLWFLPFGLLLSYLWPLWDSRNQTLHDKMANTIVVQSG